MIRNFEAHKETIDAQKKTLKKILASFDSIRQFAREIEEDPADISRWSKGQALVSPRATVKMVRKFKIKPEDVRPDVFSGVGFVFRTKGDK